MTTFPVNDLRTQFPALKKLVNESPAIYFDGPAGSQVPTSVAEAISDYLLSRNANHCGPFATSQESDELLDSAHAAVADLLGTDDPDCVAFGANMTSLTFALSRALSKTWKPGDEIIVSRLDHDANFTPWVLAAQDAGVTVRYIDVSPDDCTLDQNSFEEALSERTKLVALGYASNATGTLNPIAKMIEQAHEFGAKTFIDAVHYAPHGLIDVTELDADFLACSAYKFFGPHVGILWGKRQWLESLDAYKLRPAPNSLPGKWMTGTQNHEGILGVKAAIDYLADVGRRVGSSELSRRDALREAFSAIEQYERELLKVLLDGLSNIAGIKVWGITDADRFDERVPTICFTHEKFTSQQIAERLGEKGIFVWPGNYYAQPFTEAVGLEPEGAVRVGLLHYNTREEVERFLATLPEVLQV
jgi:cysteine desulfurase family protein (TIGR01976 family)